MKHKLIKLISVIVIAAFAWQDLIWANSRSGGLNLRYGLSLGQNKGEAVLTGVRAATNPLSPGQSLRPRAMAERNKIEMHIVDVDEVDDINQAVSSISEINNRIGGIFKIANRDACDYIRRSYHRDPHYLGLNLNLRTFLIMISGEIIGYVVYNKSGDKSKIEYIVVDPDFQGRGAGTILLRKVFEFAKENGKNFVTVETYTDNEQARAFYRKRGRVLCKLYTERFIDSHKDSVIFTFYLTWEEVFKGLLRFFRRDGLETTLLYSQI